MHSLVRSENGASQSKEALARKDTSLHNSINAAFHHMAINTPAHFQDIHDLLSSPSTTGLVFNADRQCIGFDDVMALPVAPFMFRFRIAVIGFIDRYEEAPHVALSALCSTVKHAPVTCIIADIFIAMMASVATFAYVMLK